MSQRLVMTPSLQQAIRLLQLSKLELAEEPEDQERLRFQIASLLEEMLGDAPEAIVVYNEIVEASPENGRALQALSRLYQQEEQWLELAEVLTRQLGLAEEEAETGDEVMDEVI